MQSPSYQQPNRLGSIGEQLGKGEYNRYFEYGGYVIAVILVIVASYLAYQGKWQHAFGTITAGFAIAAVDYFVFRKVGDARF